MSDPVNDYALDLIWREGRSYNGWLDKDVPETLIRAVYDLAKMGATSANCCPARFVFIRPPEAKERLKPHLMEQKPQDIYYYSFGNNSLHLIPLHK